MIDDKLPLYKIIEKHAVSRAKEIAASYEKTELSYDQLNSQANQLAHTLIAKKVAPGNTVAVYLLPSTDILVSILAIHKIGCIYVPIDPGFPKSRIHAILNEIKPRLILGQASPEGISAEYLSSYLNITDWKFITGAENNPEISVGIEDISHIYFTSGTTGKPKGVLSTHRNLIHYISVAIDRYEFSHDDVFLAGARFTFSISMFELMVPLVAGGKVIILPREVVLDLNRLSQILLLATVFHFGPSLLKQLLPYIENNYHNFDVFDRLTHVSSGGDMVPPYILEKLKKIFRFAKVFVIYGSSEISCMGCTYEVPRNKTILKMLVGAPHKNVSVIITDKSGKKVPIGVSGNIYFSGKGLVKGYLNLPDLTREKFTLLDGERYYSIGDIGRFDREGNIELLGREDFQVQIRGMRVELFEIEECLRGFPAISDCVVVGNCLKGSDEKSLIAYLVGKGENEIVINDLKKFISDQLPDYMIPSIFIKLEKLPTNHNSKLDRSLLPVPTSENILVSAEFKLPTNDTERKLVNIWEEIFKLKKLGIDHDFFELGGDSLLALNFLMEVEHQFNKFIPISSMLTASTIREIAKIITSEKQIDQMRDIAIIKGGNSDSPLFCIDGILSYKDLAYSLNSTKMVCGVYLEHENAEIDKATEGEEYRVFSSIENVVTRFQESIKKSQPHGPYFLCGHSFGGIIALEIARKFKAEGEIVKLVAMFDAFAPGYKQSLSNFKRITFHLGQLLQFGWPYFRQKVADFVIRTALRANIGYNLVNDLGNYRSELRDRAFNSYSPQTYQGEVILFRARERAAGISKLKDLGWGKFIQHLEIHEISGDHYGILNQGHVEELASILRKKMG